MPVLNTSDALYLGSTEVVRAYYGADQIYPSLAPPPDVTPNAVNWNDLSTGNSTATTNTQTISGINQSITLRATFTEDRDNYTLQAIVNGSLVGSPVNSPGNFTFTVSNNDTVAFRASGGETRNSTATITNTSDGNAVLDTFGIELEE
jgi:hypothetical protein